MSGEKEIELWGEGATRRKRDREIGINGFKPEDKKKIGGCLKSLCFSHPELVSGSENS